MLWAACCLRIKHGIIAGNKGWRMEEKVVETIMNVTDKMQLYRSIYYS
jgi:hypothetical protein